MKCVMNLVRLGLMMIKVAINVETAILIFVIHVQALKWVNALVACKMQQ